MHHFLLSMAAMLYGASLPLQATDFQDSKDKAGTLSSSVMTLAQATASVGTRTPGPTGTENAGNPVPRPPIASPAGQTPGASVSGNPASPVPPVQSVNSSPTLNNSGSNANSSSNPSAIGVGPMGTLSPQNSGAFGVGPTGSPQGATGSGAKPSETQLRAR